MRFYQKIYIVVLSFVIIGAFSGVNLSLASTATLGEEQKIMGQLRQEASQTDADISAQKARTAVMTNAVAGYDRSLQNIAQAQSAVDKQLTLVTRHIRALNRSIAITRRQFAQDKADLDAQLQFMYEDGTGQYLAVLFGATSFDDLLTRFTDLQLLAQERNHLFTEVKQMQRLLAVQKKAQMQNDRVLQAKVGELRNFAYAQAILRAKSQSALTAANQTLQVEQKRTVVLESQIQLTQSQITQIEQETQKAQGLMNNASYVQQQRQSLASVSAQSIIKYGETLLNVPYLWGGASPSGFDCSGYVQYVFKHFGIALPRTSESQFAVGVPVSQSDLQPGDLVFFSTYAPGATHDGIYIGQGMMVNAEDQGVVIDSISNSYWGPRYIGARRVLK